MKVISVYSKFLTPQNLQQHMLRVASLAQIISNYWQRIKIDQKAIIQCCLLHDIAKPITFDIAKQAQFGMSTNDIKNLKKLQNLLITNYGQNEHAALINICRELGLSSTTISLVNNLEWKYISRLLAEKNLDSLITIYCDMRISPKGVLTLKERFDELKERTGKSEDYYDGLKVEQIITNNISISINNIANEEIDKNIQHLLQLELT